MSAQAKVSGADGALEKISGPDGKPVDLSGFAPYQRITMDMVDAAPEFVPIYLASVPFTMTSAQNMFALFTAVKYVAASGIDGDIVECGVWAGGSCMIAALTLQSCNSTAGRRIWLYDTFNGMAKPTADDRPIGLGRVAVQEKPMDTWRHARVDDNVNRWCYASQDDVRKNLATTGYPAGQMTFVEGKVEDTMPAQLPATIACLRLDTDWYASTYHELTHLYPLLAPGGVLILDDYGFWAGQKKAVDQYFSEHAIHLMLHRVDANARVAIKTR